jgi:hypothetical protein
MIMANHQQFPSITSLRAHRQRSIHPAIQFSEGKCLCQALKKGMNNLFTLWPNRSKSRGTISRDTPKKIRKLHERVKNKLPRTDKLLKILTFYAYLIFAQYLAMVAVAAVAVSRNPLYIINCC